MIRLLNAKEMMNAENYKHPDERELKGQQTAPYVIVSHRWREREVIYEDMTEFKKLKASGSWEKSDSAAKVVRACQKVLEQYNGKVVHLWMDTVCINKQDPAEMSSSINSMYQWYKKAEVCFAYLDDCDREDAPTFTKSQWFTRGWTLQELVAPKNVIFYDKNWKKIGDKTSLKSVLTKRTNISENFLLHLKDISLASVSQRMSWFSGRETTVPEDTAYCLLGLFGVNMSLLYGEGLERAFRRLQEEIMRYSDDHSLFAWRSDTGPAKGSGLLAASPHWFRASGEYEHKQDRENQKPYQMTNKGICIPLRLQQYQGHYIASIDCPHGAHHFLGVYFERDSPDTEQYHRIKTDEWCIVQNTGRGNIQNVYVKPPMEI
jgi:Heterokaryon incompatibility protein (HET)